MILPKQSFSAAKLRGSFIFLAHAYMILRPFSYKHLAVALSFGLALRLFFIIHFPFHAGDTRFYDELARNWLDHHVYGLFVRGQLMPVDMRMPGYPAFLALLYEIFGRSPRAVMLVQAVIDLITCVLTALIAARLAPTGKQKLAANAALWMAALCPFTANYTAVLLTETLATFLTTLAVLVFVVIFQRNSINAPRSTLRRNALFPQVGWWLLGGLLVGVGTLVRPETPLLLLAVGLVLAFRWRRQADWSKLSLAVSWLTVGLLLPLVPWAARNARTLGRVEFLAPRYAQTYGDFIPRGFYAWTQTWMDRFGEAYTVTWKLGKEPIRIEALPDSAFDSQADRFRVAELLDHYNSDLRMTPALDYQFAILASERTWRKPLRTYLAIPLARIWAMWFTPRIALLPYSGDLWPPAEKWRGNPTDFDVTLAFGIFNFLYFGLALLGTWLCRKHPAVALLVTYLAVRTVFLTQLQTVEPRYLIICFPLVLALGAEAWTLFDAGPASRTSELTPDLSAEIPRQ